MEHVRPQAQPGRIPRRIQADPDQRPRLRHLRAHAPAGPHRRQAGPGPHGAVRRADAARAGRGLHRLSQVRQAALVRLGHQPLPGRHGRCRPTSAWSTAPARPPTRARSTSAPRTGRCNWPAAPASATSACRRHDPGPPGRPPRAAGRFDNFRREAWTCAARAGTWTPTRPGPSTSSPRPRPRGLRPQPGTGQGPRTLGGQDDKYVYVGNKPDSPWEGQKFLLARRLVEAGVPGGDAAAGGWDHHGNVVSSQGGTISSACDRCCRCWTARFTPW